jgi:hypothetical protein
MAEASPIRFSGELLPKGNAGFHRKIVNGSAETGIFPG